MPVAAARSWLAVVHAEKGCWQDSVVAEIGLMSQGYSGAMRDAIVEGSGVILITRGSLTYT